MMKPLGRGGLALVFAIGTCSPSGVFAAQLTYGFGDTGLVVLDQLSEAQVQGRVYVPDHLGNPEWAYDIKGTAIGEGLDLQFYTPAGDKSVFQGMFEVPAVSPWNPGSVSIIGLTGKGIEPTISALLLQGQLDHLLKEGDAQALSAAGHVTWSTDAAGIDLKQFASSFEDLGLVTVLANGNADSLYIKSGAEELVLTEAKKVGLLLVADIPPPSGRHIVLRAREGAVMKRDVDLFDKQPVVRAALQQAIHFRSEHFTLTPISGTDFQLIVVGSHQDFGLGSTFANKFYRLVFRIAVSVEPSDIAATNQNLIRIIFERGELKVQNGAQSIEEIDEGGFVNIETTEPDREKVPPAVADMVAEFFIAAFQATRLS